MAPVPAKVVTIITEFAARQLILDALAALAVRSFTSTGVEGSGVHGEKRHGFVQAGNLQFVIVVSEPLSVRLLTWVEQSLLPHFPSVAYSADVLAVTARAID